MLFTLGKNLETMFRGFYTDFIKCIYRSFIQYPYPDIPPRWANSPVVSKSSSISVFRSANGKGM